MTKLKRKKNKIKTENIIMIFLHKQTLQTRGGRGVFNNFLTNFFNVSKWGAGELFKPAFGSISGGWKLISIQKKKKTKKNSYCFLCEKRGGSGGRYDRETEGEKQVEKMFQK